MKALLPYFHYLKPHWRLLLPGILCSIVFGVSSAGGIPFMINVVMSDLFEKRVDNPNLWPAIGVAAMLVGIFVIRGVFGFVGGYFMSWTGMNVAISIRDDLFAKLQSLPLAFFESNKKGDLLTKINNDAGAIQTLIIEVAAECVRQPATMLVAIGYLVVKSFTFGEFAFLLLFILAVPVLVLPVKMIGKHLKRRGREMQESHAHIMQHLTENLDALVEVRSFGLEGAQQEEFSKRMDYNRYVQLKLKKYELSQQPSMEIIVSIVIGAVCVFAYAKGITFATFAELGAVLYFTFDPLKRILRMFNIVHRTEGSLDRVSSVMDMELPMRDPEVPTLLERARGDIRFEGVTFAYADEPVLYDLSVDIAAGTNIALVGPSGAGKSTFIKLIPRFYDVSEGRILLDGSDIRDFRQADLRRNIAVVSQAPVLFDRSLHENILLGRPEATREEVEEAARRAYAHDFIMAFDKGYDTLAGERGDRLSGGQKQRIALARAFLRDAPILLLDEATSALDSESESFIQKALAELVKGKTVFSIAHRLSTIRHADRILVFEAGRIVAQGTHDSLLEDSDVYRNLVKKQSLA